ncbi:MAG: soluble lytic murein transglycosylase-like protein [Gammaproteobacteria bacterium]|jgi:soluble lytic murein transglycosylase-like protein
MIFPTARALVMAITVSLGVGVSPTALADIWKRVDANGMSHFSNRYMGKGSVLVMRTKKRSASRGGGAVSKKLAQNKALYTPLIEKAARQYQLDPNLIHAVVRAESAYRADAESNKGAVGLMQLMPATAKRYGVIDRLDPAQNIRGGTHYLRDLLLQFRNMQLAIAAYNAGENAVIRYGHKIPPYPETQNYVQKVIRFYHALRSAS